jgi:membrane protein implicated in regulation of membrane protease activity
MTWSDFYLLCFSIGALWSVASLLLGGLHLGHGASGHAHLGHGHIGHAHGPHLHGSAVKGGSQTAAPSWLGAMVNPSCAAIYLAWFGGIGYLLTRHSGLAFWFNLFIAVVVGITGAWILASFLRFLQSREKPLDPADYDMVGVLGKVSCSLHPNGVGEVIYLRDGARTAVPARSDDNRQIAIGEEVIVTRYEKGIAYVRTWDAMTQSGTEVRPESSTKETKHVVQ